MAWSTPSATTGGHKQHKQPPARAQAGAQLPLRRRWLDSRPPDCRGCRLRAPAPPRISPLLRAGQQLRERLRGAGALSSTVRARLWLPLCKLGISAGRKLCSKGQEKCGSTRLDEDACKCQTSLETFLPLSAPALLSHDSPALARPAANFLKLTGTSRGRSRLHGHSVAATQGCSYGGHHRSFHVHGLACDSGEPRIRAPAPPPPAAAAAATRLPHREFSLVALAHPPFKPTLLCVQPGAPPANAHLPGAPTRQLTTFAPLRWTANGSAALEDFRDTLLPRMLNTYTAVEAAKYEKDKTTEISRCGGRAGWGTRPGQWL